MAKQGISPTRGSELGEVVNDRSIGIELASTHQNAGDCRRNRFRHRLRKVQRAWGHTVQVLLVTDHAMVHD